MKDYEKLSKEHFDAMAQMYAESDGTYYSVLPKLSCDETAARLEGKNFAALLDVGCGTGYLIGVLAKRHEARFAGLDISPKMLEEAHKKLKGAERVELREGSADKLPYRDGTFDVVTCIMSFHHYPYPEKAVSEAYRVLKSGGTYILSDVDKTRYGELEPEAYAAYDGETVRKLFENAGFEVTEVVNLTPMSYLVSGKKPY